MDGDGQDCFEKEFFQGYFLVIPYMPPQFKATAFNCCFCNAYAKQTWADVYVRSTPSFENQALTRLCFCNHCGEYSIWHRGGMIYPLAGNAPLPNPDLPDGVKADYIEARNILTQSPRGAAALLRLAIQKLCAALGEKGKDINADIASLVSKGLPEKFRKHSMSYALLAIMLFTPGGSI